MNQSDMTFSSSINNIISYLIIPDKQSEMVKRVSSTDVLSTAYSFTADSTISTHILSTTSFASSLAVCFIPYINYITNVLSAQCL